MVVGLSKTSVVMYVTTSAAFADVAHLNGMEQHEASRNGTDPHDIAYWLLRHADDTLACLPVEIPPLPLI
jgi:hypothetical protein